MRSPQHLLACVGNSVCGCASYVPSAYGTWQSRGGATHHQAAPREGGREGETEEGRRERGRKRWEEGKGKEMREEI
jgi:hypothetical protein